MDAADLPADTYATVLHDLARVNRWTLAARPTLAFLRRAGLTGPFTLLDVGFGAGDMLRRIRAAFPAAKLFGVDLNPRSRTVAVPLGGEIDYRTGDYAEQGAFDLIVSSLVAHHMTRIELVAFLRHMEGHARRGWFVNDLRRSRLAWAGYPWAARLLGVHRIVREDGALSIARAFTAADWRDLLAEAGITQARVFRAFPFRLCVARLR